ncbi:hypothetical protein GGF32_001636 [Allomyces javanicus]|nr:hypothetical protein GGF32_001636 [Allomyces javanicus]
MDQDLPASPTSPTSSVAAGVPLPASPEHAPAALLPTDEDGFVVGEAAAPAPTSTSTSWGAGASVDSSSSRGMSTPPFAELDDDDDDLSSGFWADVAGTGILSNHDDEWGLAGDEDLDDESDEELHRLEAEYEHQMTVLKTTLTTMVLPFVAKFVGRRLALTLFPNVIRAWFPM